MIESKYPTRQLTWFERVQLQIIRMALKPNEKNRWEHLLGFMQDAPSENAACFRFSAHFSTLLALMNRVPATAMNLHNSLMDQHLLNLVSLPEAPLARQNETNDMLPFYVHLQLGKE